MNYHMPIGRILDGFGHWLQLIKIASEGHEKPPVDGEAYIQ
jgi:hypothetical protein